MVVLKFAKLKFNHLVNKVGTTAQWICLDGAIYYLTKSNHDDYIPTKQINLHCTVGPDGEARYIDDFGNSPLPGCTKGKPYLTFEIAEPQYYNYIYYFDISPFC